MRPAMLTVALAALIWTAGSPAHADDSVVALRIASLDELLTDAERIADAVGSSNPREQMLADGLTSLGLTDADWVDGTRPIVVSVPLEGLATLSWVGAIPVGDAEAALGSLEGQLEGHQVSDGVHTFVTSFKTPIYVRPEGGYLVVGLSPESVTGADLRQVLDVGDLPPGSVALDLDLVPMTPMIQLGLATGRQTLQQSVTQGDADPEQTRMVLAMTDLYLDLLNNTMLNTSRVQVSLEVGDDSLLFHKRLLPRPGSTLAGLLQAQKGGLPDVARRVDATSATAMMAGNLSFTPEFRAAVKALAHRYVEMMGSLSEVMPEEQVGSWDAMFASFEGNVDRWVDCVRGDTAATYEFGATTGLRVTQLTGFTDAEACARLLDEMSRMLADLPLSADGKPLADVTSNALVHGGVGATRFAVDLDSALAAQETENDESREMVRRMLGGDEYVYYLGVAGDLLLTAVGAGAEQAFRDAVDRLGSRSKRKGMTPQMFEPLESGPGFFVAVDLARMFHEVAELDPDDTDLQALKSIPGERGTFVMGARARKTSLDFDLSFPLGFFEAIRALDDQGADEAEPEEKPAGDG